MVARPRARPPGAILEPRIAVASGHGSRVTPFVQFLEGAVVLRVHRQFPYPAFSPCRKDLNVLRAVSSLGTILLRPSSTVLAGSGSST